jgi:uncharacterized SAM-binding protein YcdF (DUF218 family)
MEVSAFFWIKKYIALFTDPLSVFFAAIFTCLLWRVYVKKRGVSRASVLLLIGLWLSSTPVFSHVVVSYLEDRAGLTYGEVSEPSAIVVFGCGHTENSMLPMSSQYQPCALYRVVHAVHLQKKTGLSVYFSGGPMPSREHSEASVNANLALSLGMASDKINVLLGAIDSASEAKVVASELGGSTVYLVTSAMHAFRASRYLEREGVNVIGSPTEHKNTFNNITWITLGGYIPQTHCLKKSASALYEYLGLASQYIFE